MSRIFNRPLWQILGKAFVTLLLVVLIVVWPIVMISFLVIALGTYIFIDGVFSLVLALKKRKTDEANWDWMFLNGMFGLFAGVLTFFNPFILVAVATYLLLSK